MRAEIISELPQHLAFMTEAVLIAGQTDSLGLKVIYPQEKAGGSTGSGTCSSSGLLNAKRHSVFPLLSATGSKALHWALPLHGSAYLQVFMAMASVAPRSSLILSGPLFGGYLWLM